MRFPTICMCGQQRLRPTCAFAQSDQSLCLSLEYSISVKLLTEHHLEFLSLKGGCTGSSESTLAKMPHCWKSHVATQLCTLVSCSLKFQLRRSIPVKVLARLCDLAGFIVLGHLLLGTFIIHLSSYTM